MSRSLVSPLAGGVVLTVSCGLVMALAGARSEAWPGASAVTQARTELPELPLAPGLEPDDWNLWSDCYLAFLDGRDVRPVLAGAGPATLRALRRQAIHSMTLAGGPVERRNLERIGELLAALSHAPAELAPAPAAPAAPSPAPPPPPPGGPITAADYFPLHMGDTWWMKDANTGEDFSLSVVGQVPVNGVKAWKMKRSRANNQEEWDAMLLHADGVYLHVRFIRGNNAVLTPPVRFSESVLVLDRPYVTVPAFPNPATGNRTQWTVKADKIEDVVTPAGTFKGCVRINMMIKDSGLGAVLSKVDLWVARKVGFVKRVGQFFGVFFVESLQRHQVQP
jgi:hypothetical protein